MADSGSINNIPATASHFLLTEELRHRLGFKGVVISDYGDLPALRTAYHVAADFPEAIAKAVNAGIDMSMTPFDYVGWNNGLIQDVQNHEVSMKRIDDSVRRILTLKFELGLFDHPYVDPNAADAAVKANRALARKAADESMTLLRNQNGLLPLAPSAKVVVTGPSADSVSNQLGGWSVSWQGVFGAVNPSEHLPVTWPSASDHNAGDFDSGGPSTAGDEPKFFDQLPGTNYGQGSGYNARYPFGFGLSYTTFQTSGLSVTSSVSRHDSVTASFTVANTGSRAGADVVPVYVHQPVSDVIVPPRRLVGFARLDLGAGASQTVHGMFPVSELAVTPADIDGTGRPEVEPGAYRVQVGSMTADFSVAH